MILDLKLIPLLGVMALLCSCGNSAKKPYDHPPGLENYQAPVTEEINKEMLGEWEVCKKDPIFKKSHYTKINIGSGIEIREIIFEDEYCQLIESTKKSALISYYHFEKKDHLFKSKIIEKKLIFYHSNSIEELNKTSFCGKSDWHENKTRDILGLFCSGMSRVSKYDLFNFNINMKDKKLVFGDLILNKLNPKHQTTDYAFESIKNNTDSEILPEKGSKNIILVYPPKKQLFEIEVKTHFQTNLDKCDLVLRTYEESLKMLDKIKILKSEIEALKSEVIQLGSEINQISEKISDFVSENKIQEYDQNYRKLLELEMIISGLNENYDYCTENCQEIKIKINEIKETFRNQKKSLSKISIERSIRKTYENYHEQIDKLEKLAENAKRIVSTKEKQISLDVETYQKAFEEYSKIKGPLSHISYKSHWDDNLKDLIINNPNFKFRHAPIQKTIMEYRIKDLPIYPAKGSILGLPVYEAKELVKGRIKFKEFPKEIFGRVNVSILAACPAYKAEDFGLTLSKKNTLIFEAFFSL